MISAGCGVIEGVISAGCGVIEGVISAGCGVIEGGSGRGRRLSESALACFSPDRYKIV